MEQDPHGDAEDAEEARAETLVSRTTNLAQTIEVGNIGAVITEDERARYGFWIVKWTSEPYTDQETGELRCDFLYFEDCKGAPKWFHPTETEDSELVRLVVGTNLELIPIDRRKNWPKGNQCNKSSMERRNAMRLPDENKNKMFDEIYIRNSIEYNPTRFIHNDEEESEEEEVDDEYDEELE